MVEGPFLSGGAINFFHYAIYFNREPKAKCVAKTYLRNIRKSKSAGV